MAAISSRLGPDAAWHAAGQELPSRPGAYVFAIALPRALMAAVGGRRTPLAPGVYVYCGSARGPGGLRARLSRHMRRGKRLRWHIDRLTERGVVIGSWTFERDTECDLVARLSGFPIAVPGFGSSDCRRCQSHLLRCDAAPEREVRAGRRRAPRQAG